jgi:hypothetical protein
MSENVIELSVVKQAENDGWYVRKVKWIGRVGAPDRFFAKDGRMLFIEFKDTGEKPRLTQQKEHKRLREAGVVFYVCDSIAKAKQILGLP